MAEFASAARILADCLEALRPPKRQSIVELVEDKRWLANTGGGTVGRFSHDRVPYIRDPEQDLSDDGVDTVVVVGPGQSGKTTIAENWLFSSVAGDDPGSFLWYMQSDAVIEAYVKDTINPMIEAHDCLSGRLGLRAVDDSLHYKRFKGMSVEFLAAVAGNLISKKAPRLVVDEVDAYLKALGDVLDKLDIRRQTFGAASKLLAMSHPDLVVGTDPKNWTAGIMKAYRDSDRRRWWWPCPHCEAYSSPNPGAERHMALVYPDKAPLAEIREAASLSCPCCGADIEDKWRREMNRAGLWVPEGETISLDGKISGRAPANGSRGYWIVGVMSDFIRGGIGELAEARVKAERDMEVTGEERPLRDVMAKRWGIPYSPPKSAAQLDASVLRERAEDYPLGQVANGVRFLTAAVDANLTWFEVLVRGWGVNGESWIVDHFKIFQSADGSRQCDPALYAEDWEMLLPLVVQRRYPLAGNPNRVMGIRCTTMDTGGRAGVTTQAYAAWLRWRRRGIVRYHGQTAGRDLFDVLPVKGASQLTVPRLRVTYPDTQRNDRKANARGQVPVGIFNPNLFKDSLELQLLRLDDGQGRAHLPRILAQTTAQGAESIDFFDQLCVEQRDKVGAWSKRQDNLRNEAMDVMVMSHVAAYCWGSSRIDWEKPPPWARDQADNALVYDQIALAVVPAVTTIGEILTPSVAAPAPAALDAKRRQELLAARIAKMAR